ncbi:MAG TPA: hypothetical protein VFQ43_00730 [Nitrososphaera sp.]|nr:hypothetical protein [Nitrososphaera sp.]
MEIAAVNQEPSAQTLAQSLRSSYRRLCRKHDGLRILQIGFIAVLSACPIDVHAQRVIYDQAKDKEAQDAATAAKDLGSGTLFQKMLHNVDLQSKQEADTTMAWVEQQMRAKIENFEVWTSPRDTVATLLPGNVGVMAGSWFSVLHLRVPWCQVKIQTQEGDERSSILCLTLEEIRTQVGEALSLTSKIRHGGHACSHLPSQRLKPQRNSTKLAQRK